jgi:hypothetical protein
LPTGSPPAASPPGAPAPAAPAGAPSEPGAAPAAGSGSPGAADDLAASPWNTANNLGGLNRDLLPSAMVSVEREPPAKAAARAEALAETPSRAPWIIVGVLAVIAIAGGIVTVVMLKRPGSNGQIAIPAGAGAVDDTPADTAPSASASAAPTAAPVVHPVVRPKSYLDDPYGDTPASPRSRGAPTSGPAPAQPTANPHRVFGTEN